jgi:hypothetical protein
MNSYLSSRATLHPAASLEGEGGHFLEEHVCIGPLELLVANGVGGTSRYCCNSCVYHCTSGSADPPACPLNMQLACLLLLCVQASG